MNWRQRIIADWPNDPQRARRCQDALRQVEEGLLLLASLGHPLHVEEGYSPPPKPEFPKVMFHLYQGGRSFACQADIDEAGPDWFPTMDDARQAAGLIKQYQRGGVFAKSLPVIPHRTTEEEIAHKAATEEEEQAAFAAKRAFIDEQRAVHRANVAAMNGVSYDKRNAREL